MKNNNIRGQTEYTICNKQALNILKNYKKLYNIVSTFTIRRTLFETNLKKRSPRKVSLLTKKLWIDETNFWGLGWDYEGLESMSVSRHDMLI